MSSLTSVIVGLIAIVAMGGCAGLASVRARRHQPVVAGVHALGDDIARDPLSGPLRAGCSSLEIGVSLDGAGRLQVGDRTVRDAGNAIGPLVLRALALRAVEYGGQVRPGPVKAGQTGAGQTGAGELTLMVEIRETDPDRAARAYAALDTALGAYPRLWTRLVDGVVTLGPVTVVLTGTFAPRHLVLAQSDRFVFIDGSFGDIGAWGAPVALVPMVSEHWSWRFGWDGIDEIPTEEKVMLRRFVAAAHADGRQVRVFGIPERSKATREAFWRELSAAGVDVISTRWPRQLARFLRPQAARRDSVVSHRKHGAAHRATDTAVRGRDGATAYRESTAAHYEEIGEGTREGSRRTVSAR
jgi:hypothetical protein